jgi:hypothetical protein
MFCEIELMLQRYEKYTFALSTAHNPALPLIRTLRQLMYDAEKKRPGMPNFSHSQRFLGLNC